jgi:hypothetical protein
MGQILVAFSEYPNLKRLAENLINNLPIGTLQFLISLINKQYQFLKIEKQNAQICLLIL